MAAAGGQGLAYDVVVPSRRAFAVGQERARFFDLLRGTDDDRGGPNVTESVRADCLAEDLPRKVGHRDIDAVIGHGGVMDGNPKAVIRPTVEEHWSHLLEIEAEVQV